MSDFINFEKRIATQLAETFDIPVELITSSVNWYDDSEGFTPKCDANIYKYCLSHHLATLAYRAFDRFGYHSLIYQAFMRELRTRDDEMYIAVLIDTVGG